MEEIHHRAVEANKHLVNALTTFDNATLQTTETLQALHEVISAIDAIYLHIESKQPNRIQLLKNRATKS